MSVNRRVANFDMIYSHAGKSVGLWELFVALVNPFESFLVSEAIERRAEV